MRRDMGGAAAASILFLAAGTGAAQAANPLDAVTDAMATVAKLAAVLNVDVEVTEATITDIAEQTLKIKWVLNNEDASIADHRSGFCVRVKVENSSWEEECFSEAPDSEQLYPSGRTRFYTSTTVEEDWEGVREVRVQVRMKYDLGGGVYTSWSPEYQSFEDFLGEGQNGAWD